MADEHYPIYLLRSPDTERLLSFIYHAFCIGENEVTESIFDEVNDSLVALEDTTWAVGIALAGFVKFGVRSSMERTDISELVRFLDVPRSGYDQDLMSDEQRQAILDFERDLLRWGASLTDDQAVAIYSWLSAVSNAQCSIAVDEILASALEYWRLRSTG